MPFEPLGQLRVAIREEGERIVCRLEGELDLGGSERLLDALPTTTTRSVALELAQVTFLDSSGLRSLLEVNRRCSSEGVACVLVAPSPAVLKVLDLVSLRDAFVIVDAADSAAPGD